MLARGEYDVASLRLGHVLQSRSAGVPSSPLQRSISVSWER